MARKHIVSCVCDRCGKEIEEGPLDQAHWIKPTFVYMKALLFMGKNERLLSREKIPYDFCKECSESFVDWFDAGKQDNT